MIKVKIPKKIKMGALMSKVKMSPLLRSDNGWRASLNQRTGVLEVDTELAGQIRDRSFYHEIVHKIDINYECGLNEENISRIANGLYEWEHDNLKIELSWEDIK